MVLRFAFLLFFSFSLYADPWGVDADLVPSTPVVGSEVETCPTPLLGGFAEVAIKFHQNVISPVQGPRSHFIPSSSHYTLGAMRKYGFFKGFIMGCDRLMRENNDDWVYPTVKDPIGYVMKYDPVP